MKKRRDLPIAIAGEYIPAGATFLIKTGELFDGCGGKCDGCGMDLSIICGLPVVRRNHVEGKTARFCSVECRKKNWAYPEEKK